MKLTVWFVILKPPLYLLRRSRLAARSKLEPSLKRPRLHIAPLITYSEGRENWKDITEDTSPVPQALRYTLHLVIYWRIQGAGGVGRARSAINFTHGGVGTIGFASPCAAAASAHCARLWLEVWTSERTGLAERWYRQKAPSFTDADALSNEQIAIRAGRGYGEGSERRLRDNRVSTSAGTRLEAVDRLHRFFQRQPPTAVFYGFYAHRG